MFCTFYLYLWFLGTKATVDVNDVKIPEALSPETFKTAKNVTENQLYIESQLKDQLRELGELHSSINRILHKDEKAEENKQQHSVNLNYSVYTLDKMEAPVIFLEPPLILPRDQIKTDKEVEGLLKSTGLEKETRNRSSDPYQITSMDEAELAEKATKSEIVKLKQDRNDIFKRMRNMSMGMPDNTSLLSDYKVLKQELAEKDLKLKEEIVRLTQIEHVKAALVKKHGAGNDVREKEEELEDREDELTGGKDEEEDDEL